MAEKSYFGEGKNIEFKREIPQKHERFLKDIIAFANCTGGIYMNSRCVQSGKLSLTLPDIAHI